jgi:hypothetical protein
LRQVEGAVLGTHGSGHVPADVRLFGGVTGSFSGGRPEVRVIEGSATMLASRAVAQVVSQTNFAIDGTAGIGMVAGDYVRIVKSLQEPVQTLVAIRRITSADPDAPSLTIDSAPSFTVEVGDTIQIFPVPPHLESVRAKLPSKPYLTGTNNSSGEPD